MAESEFLHASHNVSNLVYHFVCPAKYRRIIFTEVADQPLVQICADKNQVHFLIQSTPTHSPSDIIKVVKSITARRIFAEHPEVKKELWGGQLWSDGYFVATVGRNTNEDIIVQYIRERGSSLKIQRKEDNYHE